MMATSSTQTLTILRGEATADLKLGRKGLKLWRVQRLSKHNLYLDGELCSQFLPYIWRVGGVKSMSSWSLIQPKMASMSTPLVLNHL